MNDTVAVALIGALGSALGSVAGIIATSSLTQYRLRQLEEKVNRHNHIVERIAVAEGAIVELQHDVRDLRVCHMQKD